MVMSTVFSVYSMLRAAATSDECLYSQFLVVCIEVYFHLNFCSYKSNNDSLLLVSIYVHHSLIRFHCVGVGTVFWIESCDAIKLSCAEHVHLERTAKVECKNSRLVIRRNV